MTITLDDVLLAGGRIDWIQSGTGTVSFVSGTATVTVESGLAPVSRGQGTVGTILCYGPGAVHVIGGLEES